MCPVCGFSIAVEGGHVCMVPLGEVSLVSMPSATEG